MRKEQLKDLKHIKDEIILLDALYKRYEATATSTTQDTQGIRVDASGNKDKVGHYASMMADLKSEKICLEIKLVGYINGIPDALTRRICQEHYVEGKSLKEIAKALNYDYGYIRNVHSRFLKDVTLCDNDM